MVRGLTVAALLAASTMACALDRHRHDRPARLLLGTQARVLAGTSDDVALRGTSPPRADLVGQGARTLSAQFTMATRYHAYGGFELEAGALEARGSNFAGAYGVLGAEHVTRAGSIGVELATGWRGLRPASGEDDVHDLVTEPRVRGQLLLGSQFAIGAAAGASLGERGSWMVGLYLGFHSRAFGP